jgi:hypothetical protein
MSIGPMNYTTFGDLKAEIQSLVPEMSLDLIGVTVMRKYRQLLRNWQWSFLKASTNVNMIAPYITGTVTVVSGSMAIVGVGTVWTADMVGRFMRIGSVPYTFYQIAGVTNNTHLTLVQAYGGVSGTAQTYTMFQYIYSLGPDVREIIKLTYDTALTEKTREMFDLFDPYRATSGTPVWWADAGIDPSGFKLIEIYPPAAGSYTLKLNYWRGLPDLKDDTDVIFLRDDLLQEAALIDLYRVASNINPIYKTEIAAAAALFKQFWMDAIEEDNRRTSALYEVRDSMGGSIMGADWERNHV